MLISVRSPHLLSNSLHVRSVLHSEAMAPCIVVVLAKEHPDLHSAMHISTQLAAFLAAAASNYEWDCDKSLCVDRIPADWDQIMIKVCLNFRIDHC